MRRKKNRLTLMHKPSHSLVDMKTETFLVPNSENRAHRSHANTQISKDVFKFSFSPRSICEWNSLPSEILNSKSLNCFKTNLANYLKYRKSSIMPPLFRGGKLIGPLSLLSPPSPSPSPSPNPYSSQKN